DRAEAHQALDRGAAPAILVVERQAALGREAALADGAAPERNVGGILRIAARERADRRRAESDQGLRAVGGVALEIAPQRTGIERPGQRIAAQREMVEADPAITGAGDYLRRVAREIEAQSGIGQGRLVDQPLVLLQPGHMGIAENREALRLQRQSKLDRVRDARASLSWQAVNQVEVDAKDAGAAEGGDLVLDESERLLAVDRGLHRRVEILDTETDAGNVAIRKRLQQLRRDEPRIEFHRMLGRGVDGEMRGDRVMDPADI